MSATIEVLAPYVPAMVVDRLMMEGHPGLDGSGIDQADAAILFADISGFTILTERLAVQGSRGSELLSNALNAYFERLIERIAEHGGDVVKMAGDALIALWPTGAVDSLALATLRASLCGLDVQATLRDYQVDEGIRLTCKVGIGAGRVSALFVGGERDRWELLLAGSPLVQMGEAEHLARPGDVVLSSEAWSLVRDESVGEPIEGGFVRLRMARSVPPRPLASSHPGRQIESSLRSFIPGAIRTRLDAGQNQWLAELRRLSVLFINVPLLELDQPDAARRAREIVRVVQSRLYAFEGSLNKLSVDEKGTTLVAALGLPPLAHKDDSRRALQAARAILGGLNAIDVPGAIGVATGRVYCGEIGNARRREYTIIGRVVNLSARLMQAAKDRHEILCDEETSRVARACFRFEAQPPRPLKNIEGLVPLFRPVEELTTCGAPRSTIGRRVERALLLSRLDALKAGQGGLVVIEGEPGIGKSQLIRDLVEQAEARGIASHWGAGDAIERTSPYHAWRPLFDSLAGEIQAWLGDDPDRRAMAPLLNVVVPLGLPENGRTLPMAGQARLDNTNDLLLGLLRAVAAKGPTLLVIDDAHWMDSASWSLAIRVARGLKEALLVVGTRPKSSDSFDLHDVLVSEADDFVKLGNLPTDDALTLACDRLGVSALPRAAAELILQKAQGNPLYCEELSYALREAKLLTFDDGQCRVAPGVDLALVGIPDSVEGIINDRIDRLPPSQQMALKVASVIGRLFTLRLCQDVYPIEPDRLEVPGHLDSLSRLDLIQPEEPEPDLAYIFRHVITRDVVYDLLPFAQRKRLHHDVARWYEQTLAPDLSAYYPLLAHHWSLAGEDAQAIHYLEKAGERALRGGAYREAAGFLERALALHDRLATGTEPARVARWEYQLGEAHLSLGHLVQSREHAGRALGLLGTPIPSLFRLPIDYVVQLGFQARNRLWRRSSVEPRPDRQPERDAARLASAAFGLVGQLCYYDQDRAIGVYAAIRGLNLAERDGPSPELARSLAIMCIACGLVPAHRLAEVYRKRAFEVATGLDEVTSRAWVLQLTGMYEMGVGRWAGSRSNLEEAVAINRRLGDWRRWEESSGELARLDYYRGKYADSIQRFLDFGDEAARRGHDQAIAWSYHGRAKSLYRLGRFDEAADLLGRSLKLPKEALGGGDSILRGGLLALLGVEHRQWKAARQFADETARLIHQSPPMVSYSFEGYAGVLDTYLSLWEAGEARGEVRGLTRQALAEVRKIARIYPLGEPRAWLGLAWRNRLLGRPRRARWASQTALRSAEALDMPFELARAHQEFARHLEPGSASRLDHLDQARTLFDRLGAGHLAGTGV